MASPFHIISNSVAAPAPAGTPDPASHPRPEWLRVKFFNGPNYQDLKRIMRTLGLNTVAKARVARTWASVGSTAPRRS